MQKGLGWYDVFLTRKQNVYGQAAMFRAKKVRRRTVGAGVVALVTRGQMLELSFDGQIFQGIHVDIVRFAKIGEGALSVVVRLASARFPTVYGCKRHAEFLSHHFLAEIKLLSYNLDLVFEFHNCHSCKFLR